MSAGLPELSFVEPLLLENQGDDAKKSGSEEKLML